MPVKMEGVSRSNIYRVPAEDIVFNDALDCRKYTVDPNDLMESILQEGQHEPVLLRRVANDKGAVDLELVYGRRRVRAILKINESGIQKEALQVKAEIRTMTDAEAFQAAITENIRRRQLSPVDTAYSIDRLVSSHGKTQKEVAVVFGHSESWVSTALKILKMPAEVQRRIDRGEIAASTAYDLAALEGEELEKALSELQNGSKRTTRAAVRRKVAQIKDKTQHLTLKEVRAYFEEMGEVEEGVEETTKMEALGQDFIRWMDCKLGARAMTNRLEEFGR